MEACKGLDDSGPNIHATTEGQVVPSSKRLDSRGDVRPVATPDVCRKQSKKGWFCSLNSGHEGNHKAFLAGDQTVKPLDEWPQVTEAVPAQTEAAPAQHGSREAGALKNPASPSFTPRKDPDAVEPGGRQPRKAPKARKLAPWTRYKGKSIEYEMGNWDWLEKLVPFIGLHLAKEEHYRREAKRWEESSNCYEMSFEEKKDILIETEAKLTALTAELEKVKGERDEWSRRASDAMEGTKIWKARALAPDATQASHQYLDDEMYSARGIPLAAEASQAPPPDTQAKFAALAPNPHRWWQFWKSGA